MAITGQAGRDRIHKESHQFVDIVEAFLHRAMGEDVATAVRKAKLSGITGEIAFDAKGDRQKAQYFVLQVVSDDPAKWGDNKIVKQLTIAPPAAKK